MTINYDQCLDSVRQILTSTLQLGDRGHDLREDSPLIGHIAELDSMAVVTVVTTLEEQYGFFVDDDEISADTFSTLGTLAKFVQTKLES